MNDQLLTNPLKNCQKILWLLSEKLLKSVGRYCPNALSVLILCKNLTFFGNQYFFPWPLELRHHVIPTWESPTAADNF